jgi:hypothetical protein
MPFGFQKVLFERKKKTEIEHLCMHVKKGLGLALDPFEFLTTPLGLLVGL